MNRLFLIVLLISVIALNIYVWIDSGYWINMFSAGFLSGLVVNTISDEIMCK